MMGGAWDAWPAFGALHLLGWVLVFIAIALVFSWLARTFSRGERSDSGRALEILKERYARGEIGREEFEQRKNDLLA
jgi:putative membrane protein